MLLLLVDDDALSRDLLTLLLEAEGYEIEVAASGEAAVARVAVGVGERLKVPGVILTDMQMPGLAGNTLASALRPLLPAGTLLLAMSGSRPDSSALAGFDHFLLKPFEVSELSSLISGTAKVAAESEEPTETDVPANETGLSALDEDIYAKMSELMPAAQLGQMYAMCVDDARKRIATMQTLAAAGDDARYRSEAHAVKGGCGMIGAPELYELAAGAERDGLASRQTGPGTSSVTAMLAQLSHACYRLERILEERTRE